jgi:glycerol-3-phosphate dehydrogenase
MEINTYDLFIIGGGINGTGIARDAAMRNLSVMLCEQDDLANHTSSKSSKLIHGGLRYLEYYEFRLVREALAERDVLLHIAPHLVAPLSLMIPHNKLQRPAWLIRLGLFLYDHLGWRFRHKSRLPASFGVNSQNDPLYFQPLKKELSKGFAYSDCTVDDARLVVLNAKAAQDQGAVLATRTQFITAIRENNHWTISLRDLKTGALHTVHSRALINAAGPWVDQILKKSLQISSQHHIELVKGSHIVLPKLYEGQHAYLLQNTDKRVIFVIPYHHDFTMIGTTDIEYLGDPAKVVIEEAEKNYLCGVVNAYFKKNIIPADIVSDWSGVRPLQQEDKNPSAVTRDYSLEVNIDHNQAPLLSIFGGKITTYRKLAEHALEKLKPFFKNLPPSTTGKIPLPGGDFEAGDIEQFKRLLGTQYPWLPPALIDRYAHQYGTLCHFFLKEKKALSDLEQHFGANLYEAEVRYLIEHEWAEDAASILWRRTKLGLVLSREQVEVLEKFVKGNL